MEQGFLERIARNQQTILRKEGFREPYESLKQLTRNHTGINKKAIQQFIEKLDVDDSIKSKLKEITPFNYTGI